MYNTIYPRANIDEYKIKTENITLILQKNDWQPYNGKIVSLRSKSGFTPLRFY